MGGARQCATAIIASSNPFVHLAVETSANPILSLLLRPCVAEAARSEVERGASDRCRDAYQAGQPKSAHASKASELTG